MSLMGLSAEDFKKLQGLEEVIVAWHDPRTNRSLNTSDVLWFSAYTHNPVNPINIRLKRGPFDWPECVIKINSEKNAYLFASCLKKFFPAIPRDLLLQGWFVNLSVLIHLLNGLEKEPARFEEIVKGEGTQKDLTKFIYSLSVDLDI